MKEQQVSPEILSNISDTPKAVSPIGHILTLRLPGQGNATLLGRCIAESTTHVEVALDSDRPDLGEWFAKKFVL